MGEKPQSIGTRGEKRMAEIAGANWPSDEVCNRLVEAIDEIARGQGGIGLPFHLTATRRLRSAIRSVLASEQQQSWGPPVAWLERWPDGSTHLTYTKPDETHLVPVEVIPLGPITEQSGDCVVRWNLNEDGTLDEIVTRGHGHIEQMDEGAWFVSLGPVAILLSSLTRIFAKPRDADSWPEIADAHPARPAAVQSGGWIPVGEKLPELTVTIGRVRFTDNLWCAWKDGTCGEAYRGENGSWFAVHDDQPCDIPTHYRPLPSHPSAHQEES